MARSSSARFRTLNWTRREPGGHELSGAHNSKHMWTSDGSSASALHFRVSLRDNRVDKDRAAGGGRVGFDDLIVHVDQFHSRDELRGFPVPRLADGAEALPFCRFRSKTLRRPRPGSIFAVLRWSLVSGTITSQSSMRPLPASSRKLRSGWKYVRVIQRRPPSAVTSSLWETSPM